LDCVVLVWKLKLKGWRLAKLARRQSGTTICIGRMLSYWWIG
jgi:hypothetical protein